MTGTPEQRFWAKVARGSDSECWEWTASVTEGYGRFWDAGRTVRAHRFAYELVRGPIPDGLELDHLCRNLACVNPAHLEPVDHRTNVLRGVSPSAVHARKTHCPQGHPYDEENTYVDPNGKRFCRPCHRESGRARRSRRR